MQKSDCKNGISLFSPKNEENNSQE
jgi:hypothetical protein